MPIIKLSATEQRRLSAFFTCLLLAVLAWVFTVLSNSYKFSIKGVLTFKNTPQKRAFHALQPDTVNVTIKGSGWQMLFSRMNNQITPIPVDLQTLENKSFIVLSSQLDLINSKKEISQQISGFYPDTLYFDFTNRKEKRVQVQFLSSINYQHQYAQAAGSSVRPAYVIVNGPADVIDKITGWQTDTLKLDSINETVNELIKLKAPAEGNVSIYPKSVQVTVPVDEFTEKTIQLPVNIINNHNYDNVKIFPQKVRLTFKTSLSKYTQTDEEFFEATANLDLWRLNSYKTLPVVIAKLPEFVKIVKIEPRTIDFIIRK